MGYLDYGNRVKRINFSKISSVLEIPHLIRMQKDSYSDFLQENREPDERKDVGLQAAFRGVFPITDSNGRAQLDFISYSIEEPKYSEEECRERGMTSAAPLKVKFQLVLFDVDEVTGGKTIRDVKEQEVFFGDIPLMTAKGTFVVNGTERVIVSQVQRSPGVYFEKDKGRGGVTEGQRKRVWGDAWEKRKKKICFFKQKTAYEIYQCDWSSDVCSSDLTAITLSGLCSFSQRLSCLPWLYPSTCYYGHWELILHLCRASTVSVFMPFFKLYRFRGLPVSALRRHGGLWRLKLQGTMPLM